MPPKTVATPDEVRQAIQDTGKDLPVHKPRNNPSKNPGANKDRGSTNRTPLTNPWPKR